MRGEFAQVDAVQPQQRQARRKTARRAAEPVEGLHQPAAGQYLSCTAAPVVEVAGDDQRGFLRQLADQTAEQAELLLALRLAQAEVHADGMQRYGVTGQLDLRVQQSALFVAALDRNIQVAVTADRKFGQQGIAMVPLRIHGIAPVGVLRPHAVGEEFVVRPGRPAGLAAGVPAVFAVHFLEKHQVGVGFANGIAQFRKDETTVERGETLVGVHRQDRQRAYRRDAVLRHDGVGFVRSAHEASSRRFPLVEGKACTSRSSLQRTESR
ncbi:hypothetical protein D9M71_495570 [compost metagenome]